MRHTQYSCQIASPSNHWTVRVSGVFLCMVVGTLASSLGSVLLLPAQAADAVALNAPSANTRPIRLGVVRSPENSAQWQNIAARLDATGLEYQTLELSRLSQVTELEGLTVLFLPSVEMMTAEQVTTLEQWVNRGGRLVASGPVGNLAEASVRQRLRSLLGAYWAFPLAKPAALDVVNDPAYPWAQSGQELESVWGGVVLPTNAMSHAVAIWQNSPNTQRPTEPSLFSDERTAAIITNERATFMGWRWGMSSAQPVQFDARWLLAAVSQYGTLPPSAGVSSPTATAPSPAVAEPEAIPPSSGPATATERSPREQAPRFNSSARFRIPTLGGTSPRPVQPSVPPSGRTQPSTDPAEQVAPPALQVVPSALPINTYDALVMRQELENLVGRYESALLAAQALQTDIDLQVEVADEPVLTASTRGTGLDGNKTGALAPALQEAQALLRDWPTLMEQRQYSQARDRWLAVRQALRETFPTNQRFAQPEIRAVWLDRGTIVQARSPEGLRRIFDRLAEAGVNTVFFETVNAGYPIYPSRVAPEQNPLTRNWDPLKAAVELAHERDMELHAWVWAFAAGNRAHNRILGLPADYPGPLIQNHLDWANYDNRGSMIPPGQDKPFLDPANPAVRSYLLRLLGEIAENYEVDGIQLDYIRYPFQDPAANRTYGYGMAARQRFFQLTGVDPLMISPRDAADASPEERLRQRQLWQRWTEFRIEQVNSFVAEASRQLRRQRPDLIMSVAVFPFSEHERLQKIQQHWETWAQRGDVDLVVLMSYTQDTTQLERLTRPWLVEGNYNPALVLPGIRLLDLSDEVAVDQIQTLRDLPSGGYALFAVENINSNLHGILSRTQGNGEEDQSEPIPYREPFQAAAARYSTLLREWSWLMSNGLLSINASPRDQWIKQAEDLQQALEALADSPSARHWEQARSQLQQFRSGFARRIDVDAVSSRYRVQAWENRLATLDDLLNYGQRAILQRADRVAESSD